MSKQVVYTVTIVSEVHKLQTKRQLGIKTSLTTFVGGGMSNI